MGGAKLVWPLMTVLVLALALASCGESEESATSTPGRGVSPTAQVRTAQPLAIDLATTAPLLTIFAIDEGDLRNDTPSLAVGDFNNDGVDDLVTGVRFGDGPDNSRKDAGEAYVVLGSPDVAGTLDPASGQQDLTIFGAAPDDNLGYSVSAGDINNDGFDDVIVSAPFSEGPEADLRTDRGEVYVIFGRSELAGTVDIGEGQQDLTIVGAEGFSLLGDSIATGDVNGDGIVDLVLGAPFAGRVPGTPPGGERTTVGEVYVIFGSPDLTGSISIPQGQQDFTISGPEEHSELGDAVAAGDVNGDGKTDIIAAAEAGDGPKGDRINTGVIYVVYGSADLSGKVDTAEGQEDMTIVGGQAQEALGFAAASGDVNDDDIDDIILVAQRASGAGGSRDKSGEAYVVFGSRDPRRTIDILAGDQDVTIVGADAHDLLSSCAAGYDINGDGRGDLLLGSSFSGGPDNGRDLSGEAYVIFGSPDLGALLDLGQGGYDIVLYAAEAGDRLGSGLTSADINGDGRREIIVVATQADGPDNGRVDAGEIYAVTPAGPGS